MLRTHARLIAGSHIAQVRAVLRSEQAGAEADAAVHAVWRDVLTLLRSRPSYQQARHVFRRLIPAIHQATYDALRRGTQWGYRTAVATVRRHVPRRWLLALVRQKWRRPALSEGALNRRIQWDLLEEEEAQEFPLSGLFGSTVPGGTVEPPDLFALLFPPPDLSWIDAVVRSSGWEQRIASITGLGAPDVLASMLINGLAQGLSQQDIARTLLPHVDGVRSSARRLARTECMRVAGAAQMKAHEGLGDIVQGYQIHATIDQNTRPHHAARSGTIYWRRPKPGQLSMAVMPRPPEESPDPRQHPPGTPRIAQCCRCWISPVLLAPDEDIVRQLEELPVATPDHEVYSDFFASAPDRLREQIVGVRRHAAVVSATRQARPGWEHFLDSEAKGLLSAAELGAESSEERRLRVAAARLALRQRREQLRQTRQFGAIVG